MRSIFPESVRPSPRSSPPKRRALAAERHLEALRDERELRRSLRAHERLEVAPERLVELLALQLGQLHAHAVHRLVEAAAQERQRAVELRLVEPLDAELLRDAAEELVQRAVRDRAAQLRVDVRVDRPRIEQPVDEPRGRAVGEALELRHVEARPLAEVLEDERVAQQRRPAERVQRTVEPAVPAVREREPGRLRLVVGRERRQRAQPLALGRRRFERPRQRRERAPRRRVAHVLRREEPDDLVPERARLARRALVARRLAHEVEPPRRARARRVEEVAVARDLIGLHEPRRTERAARVVVEERRGLRPPRERSLLEPEHEDDLEAARARAQEVEHRDASALASVRPAHGRAFERADDLLGGERAADLDPALELGDQPRHGFVRAQVAPRVLVRRRMLRAVRVAEHARGRRTQTFERRRRFAQLLDDRERIAVRARASRPRRDRAR